MDQLDVIPCVLDKLDELPFANTPLHVAASNGQTCLAMEIMNLKPSLGRKLNLDGLSPLHLALLNKHFHTVKRFFKFDKELIRVKGRGMLTPLHHAAETDDCVDVLAEFLHACPESIEDQTVQGETALHIAVKNHRVRALGVLMEWVKKSVNERWVMAIQDEGGNTILHTAVSTSDPKIVKCLVRGYGYVNERNFNGDTALDVVERLAPSLERITIEKILRKSGASRVSSLVNGCTVWLFLVIIPGLIWLLYGHVVIPYLSRRPSV